MPRGGKRGRGGASASLNLNPALVPVSLSQTYPFQPTKVQTSILETQNIELKPVNSISNPVTILEFIFKSEEFYLDLSKVLLKLTFEVKTSTGAALPATDVTTGLINNIPSSMLSRVECYLQERNVQTSCDLYNIRSDLETLLNYSDSSADGKLGYGIFSKDTAGKTQSAGADNEGWSNRRKHIVSSAKGGLVSTVMHPLHLDISTADALMINGVTLRIRLVFAQPSFYVWNALPATTGATIEQSKVLIHDASLILTTVTLVPDVVLSNERLLDQTPARYPIKRTDVRSFLTPASGHQISIPNAFLGSLPSHLCVGLFNAKHIGAPTHATNPLELLHMSFKGANFYINSNCISMGTVTSDAYGGLTPIFYQLYSSLGLLKGNDNIMINYDDFRAGFFILSLDLTSTLQSTSEEFVSLNLSGNVRIEIDFEQALSGDNILTVILSWFPGALEVSKERMVNIE